MAAPAVRSVLWRLHLSRQFCTAHRTSQATAAASLQDRLHELKRAMTEAIEVAETAGPSATQLMLETDPAARGPREQYELHYAELALVSLHSALEMQEQLRHAVGSEEASRLLRRERLHILAADVLRWRDRTQHLIARVQQRQAANQVSCDA